MLRSGVAEMMNRRELPNAEILNVPGTHMDFLFTSREQVVTAMWRFLGTSAPQK